MLHSPRAIVKMEGGHTLCSLLGIDFYGLAKEDATWCRFLASHPSTYRAVSEIKEVSPLQTDPRPDQTRPARIFCAMKQVMCAIQADPGQTATNKCTSFAAVATTSPLGFFAKSPVSRLPPKDAVTRWPETIAFIASPELTPRMG